MGQSEHIKKSFFSLGLSITFLGMGNTKGQIICKFLFVVKLIFIIHFLKMFLFAVIIVLIHANNMYFSKFMRLFI